MRSAVLMPVYNEEATLQAVLDAVRDMYDGPIVIVDDGSTDGTAAILKARTDVRVVTFPENRGYGKALAMGVVWARDARVRALVTMDVDGQHEPRHIGEFLGELSRGDVDIVSGSRYLPGSGATGAAPPERLEVNRRVTEEINRVTGWGVTDAFCGFKAYRMAALDGMSFAEPGYGMPMELWAKAWRAGLRVRELPVERIYFDHDRSFGADLDDPDKRLRYYLRVWGQAAGEGAR